MGFGIDVHLAVAFTAGVISHIVSIARAAVVVVAISVAARSATATTLRARAWRVGAAILSVGDTQVSVFRLVLDGVDGLDGVGDIGEVDEGTVPAKELETEVRVCEKSSVLFLQEIDQLNITVLSKVALQLLVAERFEVFNVADVDIPSSARVHCKGQRRRKGSSVLAPSDFETTVVESHALVGSHLEEGESSGWVNKGDELEKGRKQQV